MKTKTIRLIELPDGSIRDSGDYRNVIAHNGLPITRDFLVVGKKTKYAARHKGRQVYKVNEFNANIYATYEELEPANTLQYWSTWHHPHHVGKIFNATSTILEVSEKTKLVDLYYSRKTENLPSGQIGKVFEVKLLLEN